MLTLSTHLTSPVTYVGMDVSQNFKNGEFLLKFSRNEIIVIIYPKILYCLLISESVRKKMKPKIKTNEKKKLAVFIGK